MIKYQDLENGYIKVTIEPDQVYSYYMVESKQNNGIYFLAIDHFDNVYLRSPCFDNDGDRAGSTKELTWFNRFSDHLETDMICCTKIKETTNTIFPTREQAEKEQS